MAEQRQGRFHVDPDALRCNEIALSAQTVHHMRVMRLRAGDRVRLFDGSGREVEAELGELADEGGHAIALRRLEPTTESALRIVLVQAIPVKLPRMDAIVRQVTELGVHRVVPVITEHSQLPGGGIAVIERRASRWRRIATAAASQSGRSTVPRVESPVRWGDLDWDAMPRPMLLLCASADQALHQVLRGASAGAVTVAVGPEGGWSDAEQRQAVRRQAAPVALGPRILRADSAAVVAISVLQYEWGDLAASPPTPATGC